MNAEKTAHYILESTHCSKGNFLSIFVRFVLLAYHRVKRFLIHVHVAPHTVMLFQMMGSGLSGQNGVLSLLVHMRNLKPIPT